MPGTTDEKNTLAQRLASLAARTEVAGKVIDLSASSRIVDLRNQAATNAACPFAKNLLAEAIKDVVDSYRANNPGLRYVTIVGGDNVIPFFRSPDESLLGQESGYFPPVGSTTAVRVEPSPRLRPEPGRVRIEDGHLAALEHLPGAGSRGGSPRRDCRRGDGDARRVPLRRPRGSCTSRRRS